MSFIDRESLDTVFRQLRNDFRGAYQDGEDPLNSQLATIVPTTTASVRFDALFDEPQMRKWTAERVFHQLRNYNYSISHDDFEVSIKLRRNDILDDNIGLYSVQAANGGTAARLFLPRKIAETIDGGDATVCYDGQFFFDTDHPVGEDGDITTVSNLLNDGGANAATPWYLMDLSKPLKPIVVTNRQAPQFQMPAQSMDDMHTFLHKEFLMGADARAGFGYGQWRSAIRNEGALTFANVKATDLAMVDFRLDKKDENGRRPKAGYKATHLVCGETNRYAANAIVGPAMIKAGSDPLASDDNVMIPNPIKGLQVLVVSWLP